MTEQQSESTEERAPQTLTDEAGRPINRGHYVAAVTGFSIACLGGVSAAIAYALASSEQVLGVCLAIALGGIGFGLVSWSKYLDLDEAVVQQREPLRTTPEEQADFHDEVAMTSATIGRRGLLVVLFSGSIASLAIGFFGPIGSLGPRPDGQLKSTGWTRGSRLVTGDGTPITAESIVFDQLATVFPEGSVGRDDSQVVLLRLRPDLLTDRTTAGGTVDGWVAYSKICTHAGCSVGLFGVDDRAPDTTRQLVCPCHQSVFDPVDAARPVGGPAPRSLPQLPLAVDDAGYLIATSDFDRPVGPITWNEG